MLNNLYNNWQTLDYLFEIGYNINIGILFKIIYIGVVNKCQ